MAASGKGTEMRHLLRGVFKAQAREPLLTLGRLRQHWAGVVGPELAARTEPHRLEGHTLWIAAPDACWAYELQFFKPELLASVQAFLESPAIRDLRFRALPAEAPTSQALPTEAPPTEALPTEALPSEALPAPSPQPEAPPTLVSAAPGTPERQGPGRSATPAPETPPALERASAAIGDPALREVFRRSLAKQRRAQAGQRDKPQGE